MGVHGSTLCSQVLAHYEIASSLPLQVAKTLCFTHPSICSVVGLNNLLSICTIGKKTDQAELLNSKWHFSTMDIDICATKIISVYLKSLGLHSGPALHLRLDLGPKAQCC